MDDRYQGEVSNDGYGRERVWHFTDEQLRSFAADHGMDMPKLPDGWHLVGEQDDGDEEDGYARPHRVHMWLRYREFDDKIAVLSVDEVGFYPVLNLDEIQSLLYGTHTLDECVTLAGTIPSLRDACANGFPEIVARLGKLDVPWDQDRENAWRASHGLGPDEDFYWTEERTPVRLEPDDVDRIAVVMAGRMIPRAIC